MNDKVIKYFAKNVTATLVMIATVSLVVSCNKINQTVDPADGIIRVTAKIEPPKNAESKAGPINQGDVLTGVKFYQLTTTAPKTVVESSLADISTTGVITFAKSLYYDMVNKTESALSAWWPDVTMDANLDAIYNVDGKTDIIHADYTEVGSFSRPQFVQLEFGHLLARIEVICKADPGQDITNLKAVWGQIQKIEIVGSSNRISSNYNEGHYAKPLNTVDVALLKGDYSGTFTAIDLPANDNQTINAAAIVVAQATVNANETFNLKITTQRTGTQSIAVNCENSALENGKIHRVTLTFSDRRITPAGTVADWATEQIEIEQ